MGTKSALKTVSLSLYLLLTTDCHRRQCFSSSSFSAERDQMTESGKRKGEE
jgi:hypothetical protein